MRIAAAAAALALSSCATSVHLPGAEGAQFDPIAFFAGRTQGQGMLNTLLAGPVRVTVDSLGQRNGDSLVLDQTIRIGAKPPRLRRWTMRRMGVNLYSGTLTDASGPVRIRTQGPRAYISYETKNGLKVEQQLALQSDPRTLLNRLEVKRFGLRIATLEETIRKAD